MTSSFARTVMVMAAVFAGIALATAPLAAQDWPQKPIRIVVGFAPGGGTDIVARIIAPPLAEVLKQPVEIDNRPGAGGITGADVVAKAPKDGYTAFMMNSGHAVSDVMFKALPYDSVKDFQPVALLASASLVAVTSKSFPASDIKSLVAKARAEPGKVKFASVGVGSIQHFSGELLRQLTGIDIVHVPFGGVPPALAALRSGEVQFMFELVQTVLGPIKAGELKPLGVTAAVRWPSLGDVPTVQEQGIAGFDVTSWYGLAFPAGTPRLMVEMLNETLYHVVSREPVRRAIAEAGAVVNVTSPEDFRRHIASEIAKWRSVRDKAGIQPQS